MELPGGLAFRSVHTPWWCALWAAEMDPPTPPPPWEKSKIHQSRDLNPGPSAQEGDIVPLGYQGVDAVWWLCTYQPSDMLYYIDRADSIVTMLISLACLLQELIQEPSGQKAGIVPFG